jgi:transcriptional regulator GlxA family with amidase domain
MDPVRGGTLLLGEAEARPAADLRIVLALSLMAGQPSKRWTVKSLARSVGLSRAVFAKRFVLTTGVPPLRYLSQLRLELAKGLLQDSQASLAELAARVGYASEFAFSRAFKRRFGLAPSFFRRSAAAPRALLCAA